MPNAYSIPQINSVATVSCGNVALGIMDGLHALGSNEVGSGLGISIVKAIADRLGAEI
jgi:hypothetical protein